MFRCGRVRGAARRRGARSRPLQPRLHLRRAPTGSAPPPPATRSGCPEAIRTACRGSSTTRARRYLDFLGATAALSAATSARCARARCCWRRRACRRLHRDDPLGVHSLSDRKLSEGRDRRRPSALPARRRPLDRGRHLSGLDEALKLIELLAGADAARGVQQNTQYYPDPPVASAIPNTLTSPMPAVDWHLGGAALSRCRIRRRSPGPSCRARRS